MDNPVYRLLVKKERGKPVFYFGPVENPIVCSEDYRSVRTVDLTANFYKRDKAGKLTKEVEPIACHYHRLPSHRIYSNFLRDNGINQYKSAIEVSIDSINAFYNFNEMFSVELTKKFVYDWWNYDCPVLTRYDTNKNDGHCFMGKVPIFSESLVESGMTRSYFGDISAEEIHKLYDAYPVSSGAQDAYNYLKAQDISAEKVEAMVTIIRDYDIRIQGVIDAFADVIREEVKYVPDCFPCGFAYIYVRAKDWEEARDILQQVPNDKLPKGFSFFGHCNVSLPVFCQGLDKQYAMIAIIMKIVKEKLGLELYKTGVWD